MNCNMYVTKVPQNSVRFRTGLIIIIILSDSYTFIKFYIKFGLIKLTKDNPMNTLIVHTYYKHKI